MTPKYTGCVIWFDARRGMGFIVWKNEAGIIQNDMYLHYSDLIMDGFKSVNKGDQVSFEIGTFNNKPKAILVERIQ